MSRRKIFSFSIKEFLIMSLILAAAMIICFALKHVNDGDMHVSMVFCLAVLLISRFTKGYFYGIFSSFLAIISINYFFTYPYFAFNVMMPGYPITIASMLAVCIITSASTTQILEKEKIKVLAEKERMRANLLRAVSHDLRTPLTSIVGGASVLIENDEKIEGAERRELLCEIQDDAQWLIRMVENLLSVTKISGNSKIYKTSEAVEEIAAEAVLKLKKRYSDAPINVSVPDEILFVPMDAILIEQVLINLMENSIRHGKNVTKINFKITKEETYAKFEVSDDGIGFDERKVGDIFEGSVVTEDEQRSDTTKNMGIGLSVCKAIITAHGGNIEAGNIENGGASVAFYLPLDEDV